MSTLHADILLALHAAGKFGLTLEVLLPDLRRGRHRALVVPQLETALRDLADRSLVSAFQSALESKRWRLTGFGENALHEEGLL